MTLAITAAPVSSERRDTSVPGTRAVVSSQQLMEVSGFCAPPGTTSFAPRAPPGASPRRAAARADHAVLSASPRLELDPRGHAVTMPCGKDMSAKMSNALRSFQDLRGLQREYVMVPEHNPRL